MLLRTPLPLVESLNLSYTRSTTASSQRSDEGLSQTTSKNIKLNEGSEIVVPRSINYLENFTCLTNLKSLILCNVELSQDKSLELLSKFSNLESLDLSFNQLKTIPRVISALPMLKNLDLSVNLMDNFEDFVFLSDCARAINLETLDLRFNPICIRKQYKQFLINRLVTLKFLNGEEVTERLSVRQKIREKDHSISFLTIYLFKSTLTPTHTANKVSLCKITPLVNRIFLGP
jgi:hypothetical protein